MNMAIGELVAEPADTATGAHVLSNNLLSLQGNPSISLELQYNSLLLNPGFSDGVGAANMRFGWKKWRIER